MPRDGAVRVHGDGLVRVHGDGLVRVHGPGVGTGVSEHDGPVSRSMTDRCLSVVDRSLSVVRAQCQWLSVVRAQCQSQDIRASGVWSQGYPILVLYGSLNFMEML